MRKTIKIIMTLAVLLVLGHVDGLATLKNSPAVKESQVVQGSIKDYRSFLNVRYGNKRAELKEDDPTQDRILDIYLPKTEKPAKGYPVYVFIHGGGFTSGSKELNGNIENIFDALLKKGYAVVTINYYLMKKNEKLPPEEEKEQQEARLEGKFGAKYDLAIEEASKDAVMALKWVNKHAKEYGFDRSFVAISGGSAGAMTAIHTTFVKEPKKPRIKAVVNCWGGMSDVTKIKNASIPMFTIHGDKDDLVDFQFGLNLQKRMEEIGSKHSKMHVLEGRGHAQYQYVGENLMGEITDFLDFVRNSVAK